MYYKLNGSQKVDGKMVDYQVFDDEDQAKNDGWLTHQEVWYGVQSEETEQTQETREQLEAKAQELGIKFDGRTSDAKLKKAIDDLEKA